MLNDLVQEYDKLFAENKVPAFGYSEKNISYMIDLDKEGNIQDIKDIRVIDKPKEENENEPKQKKEPKKHGKTYNVPDDLLNTSNKIWPMYLWGKLEYMFPSKDKKEYKKFKANADYHKKMLDNVYDETAAAITKYFKNAAPVDFKAFDIDTESDEFKGAYFSFSYKEKEALTNDKLLEPWNNRTLPGPIGYSQISGKRQIIRHVPQPRIQGVKGGLASGSPLIARDRPSFAFNVHGGSINPNDRTSPREGMLNIGWEDSFKYATALNWLLKPSNHHSKIFGKMTVIFWSEGYNKNEYDEYDEDVFNKITGNTSNNKNEDTEDKPDKKLYNVFNSITNKTKIETDNVTEDIPFHICGFLPNAGRTLWALDINDSLSSIVESTKEHMENLRINGKINVIPLWKIPKLTVKEGQKVDNETGLYKQLLMSVIQRKPYPNQLVADLLVRTTQKTASNKNEKTNKSFLDYQSGAQLAYATKEYLADEVSLMKAILIRNYKKGDDIHMALNKENPSIAYQFGRLFAAAYLDIRSKNSEDRKNMQKVKEKWLRSAVETPGKVYAEFIMSANLHNASNKRIGEIANRIDAENIPKRFSQEEKLQWFLGYYQETEAFWQEVKDMKKNKEEKDKNANNSNNTTEE